ncbi:hypothetical protein JC606_17880 [Vibrio sp. IB15]|uniref:hypothetical protein n=1 Tax=Vibrio sp. IB15 TaxID=2779368 RepID=UPI0018E8F5EA|nr:hypothetical protein [Vibrio sp. IB15]MBJ2148230.1 hypothetical protein [Vibrio sp. IB15]
MNKMSLRKSLNTVKFDPKFEALEDKNLIETYFNVQLDEHRDFRILRSVERLIQSHFRGERLPNCESIRSDHYFNLLRFISVAMLYTDQAQNVIVSKSRTPDGQWHVVPAGNAFFMKKLGIERSTLDGIIASAKRLGWYISNIRYGYYQCGNGKRYYGKNSVKRVFIGLYDLLGTGKKVRESIKSAVQYKHYRDKKIAASVQRKKQEIRTGRGFQDYGYGGENQRRFSHAQSKRTSSSKPALKSRLDRDDSFCPRHEITENELHRIGRFQTPTSH